MVPGFDALVDLGHGVLDEALVECCLCTLFSPQGSGEGESFFLRVLDERDKNASIKEFFTKQKLTPRCRAWQIP